MNESSIRSLEKKLELKAGFIAKGEAFSLRIRPESETSYWNHKRLLIAIGLKGIDDDAIPVVADKLSKHELAHVLYTDRNITKQELSFPFSILNILEDARGEHLYDENFREDFRPLHDSSYQRHYLSKGEGDTVFANPFNIGVLLRWRRWGIATQTLRPAELSEEQYQEFLSDWEKAIDLSIRAQSTRAVMEHAGDLYMKWESLFGKEESDYAPCGMIEGNAEELLGEGDEQEEKTGSDDSGDSEEVEDEDLHFGDPWFDWDMPYIQQQAEQLRRLLDARSESEKEFSMSGRRFDPRRMDNPPLMPFKRELLYSQKMLLQRLLLMIDGSGSMQGTWGEPFRNASHLAYILSLVFPVDIRITTSSSTAPIEMPLQRIDLLRSFRSWGGSENYRSLEKNVEGYSFVLFLTDACIDEQDLIYVRDVLAKVAKVGAGYVGDQAQMLDRVFPRNFFSKDLGHGTARMIALFLRRYFMSALAA